MSVPVRHRVDSSPKYVYDKVTGRTYREEVPTRGGEQTRSRGKTSHSAAQQLSFVDHRQAAGYQDVVTSSASQQPSGDDRMPTFVPAETERQGKEKVPDILQWARDCPVSWTNKITLDKLNVVLYSWSYVSALLAARTGRAPDLAQGELEARLQHLLHVLEVTLQTSLQTDYSGDSWKVARLYHTKVQQKVDSKQVSWVQLSNMHHNATLPHELMAAMQELANKPKQPRGVEIKSAGKDGANEVEGKKKRVCPSYSRSEIRGKCTFEVENPRQKCRYLHECTWCKSKGKSPVDHQRFFCKKRLEAEEE